MTHPAGLALQRHPFRRYSVTLAPPSPGTRHRRAGDQLAPGLPDLRALRPLQRDQRGPAVRHAAGDGGLQRPDSLQALPGGEGREGEGEIKRGRTVKHGGVGWGGAEGSWGDEDGEKGGAQSGE